MSRFARRKVLHFGLGLVLALPIALFGAERLAAGKGMAARAGGAAVEAVSPRPLDQRVVMSGHSLTDRLAEPLGWMVRAAGGPAGAITLSTIPGSPLDWRWNNPAPHVDAREEIGRFDVLVITERVPLSNTLPWHNSDEEALRWARHAWQDGAGGRGAEVLLYASWVPRHVDPSQESDPDAALPWRERLDREFGWWEEIMAHVNANRPEGAPPMRMIPATLVMAAIHDAIAEGRAPAGVDDIDAFFIDDIHPDTLGAHAVSLAHFAVIYARDPRGLPSPPRVSNAIWSWLTETVWDVVTGHPGTGVVQEG